MTCRLPWAGRIVSACLAIATPLMAAREPQAKKGDLLAAVRDGSSARIATALKNGEDPNAVDEKGMTVLMRAIVDCDASVVRLLLEKGADPNARGTNGATPLVLAAGDLAKVTALVEKGADVNGRSILGRTALHVAAAQRDSYRLVSYLVGKGADVNARDNSTDFLGGATGFTPLMLAARSLDDRTVRLLLGQGADVSASTTTGATAVIDAVSARNPAALRLLLGHGAKVNFAYGPIRQTPLILAAFQEAPEIVKILLQAGADVSAKDALGSNALTWAAMSERDDVDTVAALLQAGASADVKNAMNETPLSWAKRRGNTEIARLLQNQSVQAPDQQVLRDAVRKSVAALLPSGPVFVKNSGCVSCHNNTLPLMAASLARRNGVSVDPANEALQTKTAIGVSAGFRQALLETSSGVPDTQVSIPYILIALHSQGVPADELTSAAVHGVAAKQLPDGHWPSFINRAPIENGDIQATALAVRALQMYGAPGRAGEWKQRIAEARDWLSHAEAKTTEDKIMLLNGLVWAGASREKIDRAARDLLAEQRADGGFAQLRTLQPDAYATGKALVALREAGAVKTTDAQYRNGVGYLLRTQESDGTWHVQTRAFPFQPLKESGFAHGRDQWISAAAASWASMALSYALEPQA